MSVQIDNKKMWESILGFDFKAKIEDIRNNPTGVAVKFIGAAIKNALKDQGLEWNGEIKAIVSIKPEPLSPAPQRNNYDEIKQAEPKQENSPILSNSSNTAKNDELTEFEEKLKTIVNSYAQPIGRKTEDVMTDRGARSVAKTLLSIARKEIAEGINTEELIKQWEYKKIHSNGFFSSERDRYKEGVEDTIKKIKEG